MKKLLVFFPRLFLFLTFSFLLVRCSDDEEPQTTDQLVQGSWGLTGHIINPGYDFGTGPITDVYPFYDACEKDNIYVLNASNVGEINEGPTKCDAADPQSYTMSWVLKSNNTILNISYIDQGFTIGQDYEILQLDATTMKLKSTFVEDNVTYTETQTFTRK
jgi:hypothetical protein